jgi:hypothetical protein
MTDFADTLINDKSQMRAIENFFDIETLKRIINEMSISAWNNRMEHSHLNRWLKNFDGRVLGNENVEKIIALWLLMNFTFYSEKEVRVLCKYIYEDYIHTKLLNYETKNYMNGSSIKEKIQHIISSTIFFPLGNPSESGTNILYYFRQENGLSRKSFELINDRKYENTVYIDDVTISGTQADTYIKDKIICAENNFIITFIATVDAIKYLQKEQPKFKLIYSILLDDRSKCFEAKSFVFSGLKSEKLSSLAYQMCKGYGDLIFPEHPLGFDNGQYLFGFYYNTPDNTLPVIWSEQKKWIPAFSRYQKIYGESGVYINESKYY